MINIIQALLEDEKYNLKKSNNKIVIFRNNSNTFPEDYVEIEKTILTGRFLVSEIHRDEKRIKVETEKEEKAAIYAVVIYKKLYDDILDRINLRVIRNYLDLGEDEKALAFIIDRFNDSIFSIDYEDSLKISLIRTGDKADVIFDGEYIVKDVKLRRGYVVFYNYCEKLRYISLFWSEIQRKFTFNMNLEEILRMYILGR